MRVPIREIVNMLVSYITISQGCSLCRLQRMWTYLPRALAPFLNSEAESWGNELRRVSTLFVNLGFLEEELRDVDEDTLLVMQEVFKRVQRSGHCDESSRLIMFAHCMA